MNVCDFARIVGPVWPGYLSHFLDQSMTYTRFRDLTKALFNVNVRMSDVMRAGNHCYPSRESLAWFKVLFQNLLSATKSDAVSSLVSDIGILEACLLKVGVNVICVSPVDSPAASDCCPECSLVDLGEHSDSQNILYSGFEHTFDSQNCDAYVLSGHYRDLDLLLDLNQSMLQDGFKRRIFWNFCISSEQTVFHEKPVHVIVIYYQDWLESRIPKANQVDCVQILKYHLRDREQSYWTFVEADLRLMLEHCAPDDFVDDLLEFFNDQHCSDPTILSLLEDLQNLNKFKEFCNVESQ